MGIADALHSVNESENVLYQFLDRYLQYWQ